MGPRLEALAAEEGVPGFSFALFDDSGAVYEHVGGVKSLAGGGPIEPDTVFEAASISKPVFASIVLALADEGLFGLDSPLVEMVDRLPELADDPRSALLTPRMLLTHRGGLPNWRSRLNLFATSDAELFAPDDRLAFVADPGLEYRYSGEGYVLLQRVVEQLTGQRLQELAAQRVFVPLRMSRTSFAFDDTARLNYSEGHHPDGRSEKWGIRVALSSSTLHTTASDLARFGTWLAREIRSRGNSELMWTPQVSVDRSGDVQLSWGAGLGILTVGDRRYFWHGGNNDIFIADFIYGEEENLGYALLTNSTNGQHMVEAVERLIFGQDLPR